MMSVHHDMSVVSYVLLAVIAIGQEVMGLELTLFLGASAAILWLSASLLIDLVLQQRRDARKKPQPTQLGGAETDGIR